MTTTKTIKGASREQWAQYHGSLHQQWVQADREARLATEAMRLAKLAYEGAMVRARDLAAYVAEAQSALDSLDTVS